MRKLIFVLAVMLTKVSISQSMIEKCKPEFDYEIMMQVYTELDVYPEITDEKFTLWDFMEKNFKIPQKDFGTKTQIKFAWMVEKDGTCTFLKLLSPPDDKEIAAEAKRVVGMLPLYSPGKCGIYPVPCKVDYEFTVSGKK